MADLILIDTERVKQSSKDKAEMIRNLREVLAQAEAGKLKGICFAAVDHDGDIQLGALRRKGCGIHELIGLASILHDSLMTSLRR
jgi:hypothetical protein